MNLVKSEKELFNLAKAYAMLSDEFQKIIPEYELEKIKDAMDDIRNEVLEKGYDVDKFVHYQQLYKEMSMGEYFEFIKTL